MTCKAIERMILESEERPLGASERAALEGHLRACPGCRAFEAGRRSLREGLKALVPAALPPSLDLRTRELCQDALEAGRAETAAVRAAKVPWPVVAASALCAVLAAVWLTVTLPDLKPGETLPWTSLAAVAFLAQNVFVLFLSPVILRTARRTDAEDSRIP